MQFDRSFEQALATAAETGQEVSVTFTSTAPALAASYLISMHQSGMIQLRPLDLALIETVILVSSWPSSKERIVHFKLFGTLKSWKVPGANFRLMDDRLRFYIEDIHLVSQP